MKSWIPILLLACGCAAESMAPAAQADVGADIPAPTNALAAAGAPALAEPQEPTDGVAGAPAPVPDTEEGDEPAPAPAPAPVVDELSGRCETGGAIRDCGGGLVQRCSTSKIWAACIPPARGMDPPVDDEPQPPAGEPSGGGGTAGSGGGSPPPTTPPLPPCPVHWECVPYNLGRGICSNGAEALRCDTVTDCLEALPYAQCGDNGPYGAAGQCLQFCAMDETP